MPTEGATSTVDATNTGVRNQSGPAVAGQTVTWSYSFTNTGNVTLRGVTLTDSIGLVPPAGYTWSGVAGELAPGGTVSATRVQTLTQADVDAGGVSSILTGSGTPTTGAAATATRPASVPLAAAPLVTISQTGAPTVAGQVGLGDGVTYTFTVTNTGNVTLTGAAFTDLLPSAVVTGIAWPTATAGVLPPNGVATVTVTYALQQEDIDRGFVDNTGTITAQGPTAAPVSATSNVIGIPLETQAPAIEATRTASFSSGSGEVGSVIRYDIVVTNTGNVTLRLVEIQEALAGTTTPVIEFPGTSNILAPDGVARGVAYYTVTQADVDRGTSPTGVVVDGTTNTVVTTLAAQAPAISASHTAALAAGATGVLGDTMDYTFTLRNTGNTTLTDVGMSNTVAGLTNITPTWPSGVAGRLEPNQVVTYTATRLVTQADVDAGVVRNVTTAEGTSPTATVVDADSTQTAVTLAAGAGALTVAKTGTVRGGGAAVVGATIDYTIRVTNTGTLTVADVVVTDPKPGTTPVVPGAWPTATAGVLPPNGFVEATTSVVVTQAEFDAGSVGNTANASGRTLAGAAVSGVSPTFAVSTPAGAPEIGITKTQTLPSGAAGRAGEIVTFAFEVTNLGDVTLSGVTLTDAQARLGAIAITWPGTAGVLAPGGIARGTAQYTLTQADVDAGTITSTASTTGTPVVGPVVSATASGSTPIAAAPALTVDKTSTLATFAQQGATVNYRIEVRNTGNVTLTGVDVTDTLAGLSTPVFAWPTTAGTLRPNDLLVVTARYTIQQSDITTGSITNTATAIATAGGTPIAPVSDTDVLATPAVSAIALTVAPAVASGQRGFAGDTVVVTYRATNSGTSVLTGVVITDPRAGLSPISYGTWPGPVGVLEPGQTIEATATYIIQAGEEGGLLVQTAQVAAVEVGGGAPVAATATGAVQLPTRAAPTDPLAVSGAEVTVPTAASLLLLLAGLGLMFVARKRKRKDHA